MTALELAKKHCAEWWSEHCVRTEDGRCVVAKQRCSYFEECVLPHLHHLQMVPKSDRDNNWKMVYKDYSTAKMSYMAVEGRENGSLRAVKGSRSGQPPEAV